MEDKTIDENNKHVINKSNLYDFDKIVKSYIKFIFEQNQDWVVSHKYIDQKSASDETKEDKEKFVIPKNNRNIEL